MLALSCGRSSPPVFTSRSNFSHSIAAFWYEANPSGSRTKELFRPLISSGCFFVSASSCNQTTISKYPQVYHTDAATVERFDKRRAMTYLSMIFVFHLAHSLNDFHIIAQCAEDVFISNLLNFLLMIGEKYLLA